MALALLIGMGWQMQQARLLAPAWAALGVAVATLALLGLLSLRARPATGHGSVPGPWPRGLVLRLVALALAAVTLGFCSTDLRARWRLADALAPQLEGQDLLLVGAIVSLPQLGNTGTRFIFDIEQASFRGQPLVVPGQVPRFVRLAWYAGMDDLGMLDGPRDTLRAGQRWRLTARLRQPHGSQNPHGFDHELWLFEQGLRATGYVRASASPGAGASASASSSASGSPQQLAEGTAAPVQRLRQAVRDAIYQRVQNPAAAGVLAALAVGDQGAIEREDWELFRSTGVAHLMSISGLHVTLFAWLAGLGVGWLWRRSARLPLLWPAPAVARWGGLAAAAAYALLAGWGVPAQRTVWMLATVVLLRTLGVRWPQLAVLLAAAWVVCVVDPWALVQVGFWLSFAAVALLMSSEAVVAVATPRAAAGDARTRWPPLARFWLVLARLWLVLRDSLRTQAVATVGLAPLALVFFQQVSLVGFAANLLAIPAVTLVIMPLSLLGVLLPPLWSLAAWLLQGLMAVLGWMAQAPWALWQAAVAPPWAAAAGLLAGLLLIMPLPWRLRLLGLPLMLPLLWPAVPRPADGSFEMLAADIGQGTAVLLRTQKHLLVYDAGPQYSPDNDAGQRVLLPLLRARGEAQVDVLMLSHRDSDHVGGAASLLRQTRVLALRSSLESEHPLLATGVPHTRCEAGQGWLWDGVRFELLHPAAGVVQQPGVKPNHVSCVLRVVDAHGRSLLLTGDIEAAQEAALVRRAAAGDMVLKSDVLLVPHHGSRTSSTPAFLDAVAPATAVVQAAYRSRFGHPAPDVVQRYADRGIKVVRSDACGAWFWAGDLQECQRQKRARYWHHQPQQP